MGLFGAPHCTIVIAKLVFGELNAKGFVRNIKRKGKCAIDNDVKPV
jgi:hypothetical protein